MQTKEEKKAYKKRYYEDHKEERKAYGKKWDQEHRSKRSRENALYRSKHPEFTSKNNPVYRLVEMKYRYALKAEVLSYYGKDFSLRCCWPFCNETDIDVLTLDHVDNSGKHDRKNGKRKTGARMYNHLKSLGFPEGFQTLCMNHQLKKEIRRKKAEVMKRYLLHEKV